ncbi:ParB/RepB/Spo0J family partition protein [Rhodosalinus sediminis]|uniref:ParB/RepB/Spo0J family partition protein n=1 Tax=Rhodosalinus sediminis TaxID=1940533 RepID=UPI002354383F|nr:ParB/RepB/Spo0J family partition protein [Rhodosalinus sediminis]
MLKRIPLDQITRNPDQPRQHFDAETLAELAASIAANGLQQPITVRPVAGPVPYMIVAGERRYRAHLLLAERGEADAILCHVRRMDDETMHIHAILENLQRAEVSPLEEAVAYQRMIDDFGFSVADLARQLGITQSWRITERLRLLGLTADNRDLLSRGVVTLTQAYHMAALSPNGQQEFLGLVRAGLVGSNRACEAAAAKIAAREAQIEMPMPAAPKPRASLKGLEDRLDALGTALQPLFKEGPFAAPENLDPDEAARCMEKTRLLQRHLRQIQGEIERASAAAAA